MSADNYLYVRKVEDGHYDVTHRFASSYYRDEYPDGVNPRQDCTITGTSVGWFIGTGEPPKDPNWIFETYEEAVASVPLVPDEWMDYVPPAEVWYTTLEAAVMAAHKECQEAEYPIEYGVSVQRGLLT